MTASIRMRPIFVGGLLLTAALVLTAPGAGAATLHLTGPAGAAVLLDGGMIGFLPIEEPLRLAPGTYVLRCELPGHQPYESEVRFLSGEDVRRLQIRLMPLRRRTAVLSNVFLAGMGQHYVGQSKRGWLYNAAEMGGLLTALAGELQRSNYRKDYLLLLDRYNHEIDTDLIAYYKAESLTAWSNMEDAESVRNTGLLVAGGAVLLSVLDSLAFFPSFEAGPGTTAAWTVPARGDDPAMQPAVQPTMTAFHLGFRRSF